MALVSDFGLREELKTVMHDRDAESERPAGSPRRSADTVGLAAARVWRLRGRAWNTLRHPAGWELWRLPVPAVGWMLGAELLVACWSVYSSFKASYTTTDLVRFGVLAGCAIWYLIQSQHPEEQRRADDRRGEHIDQTAVWLGSAAVLLPPAYSLALLLMVRVQRYSIAHKAMTTFLFTTAAHAASILGVHTIIQVTSLHTWLEAGTLPQRPGDIVFAAVSLVGAADGHHRADGAGERPRHQRTPCRRADLRLHGVDRRRALPRAHHRLRRALPGGRLGDVRGEAERSGTR